MDTARIERATKLIREHETALGWLNEYGVMLTGKSEADEAQIEIELRFAGSCPGAYEATRILEAYARVNLPEIVAAAIRSCNNTIAMERDAIRQALEAD